MITESFRCPECGQDVADCLMAVREHREDCRGPWV